MYKEHRDFLSPPKDLIIWRYLTVSKFLHLIDTSQLHFTRADHFNDVSEGALSGKDTKLLSKIIPDPNDWVERQRLRTYLNCWNLSPNELYHMWESYSFINEGVAIKSTVGSIINSMEEDELHLVRIAQINYIDMESDSMQPQGQPINLLRPFFSKRKIYEKEQEVRLLYFNDDALGIIGFNFPVNLFELVNEVRISPGATPTFKEFIQLQMNKNGYNNIPITKSELSL